MFVKFFKKLWGKKIGPFHFAAAAFGGVCLYYSSIQIIFFYHARKIREEEYWQKAVELLKGYEPALEELGVPINPRPISFMDKYNQIDVKGGKVQLKIPIRGSKCKGVLYSHCSREPIDPQNESHSLPPWDVDYLEIELKQKSSSPRWTFYINPAKKDKILDQLGLQEKEVENS